MTPHIHINGAEAIKTALFVTVIFGSLHLLAASAPDNRIAQGWLGLGF